jgi:hypothetical protein
LAKKPVSFGVMSNYETIGQRLNELGEAAEKATQVDELKAVVKSLTSVISALNYEVRINNNVLARHLNEGG